MMGRSARGRLDMTAKVRQGNVDGFHLFLGFLCGVLSILDSREVVRDAICMGIISTLVLEREDEARNVLGWFIAAARCRKHSLFWRER